MDFAVAEPGVSQFIAGLGSELERTDNDVGSSFLEVGQPFFWTGI